MILKKTNIFLYIVVVTLLSIPAIWLLFLPVATYIWMGVLFHGAYNLFFAFIAIILSFIYLRSDNSNEKKLLRKFIIPSTLIFLLFPIGIINTYISAVNAEKYFFDTMNNVVEIGIEEVGPYLLNRGWEEGNSSHYNDYYKNYRTGTITRKMQVWVKPKIKKFNSMMYDGVNTHRLRVHGDFDTKNIEIHRN